jgi:carboxypeptidase Q
MRSIAAVLVACTCASAQPVDLAMYGRIREEGYGKSHVIDFAEALIDGIGPRLTGSPNLTKATEWARRELTAMGCSNVRSESWGEFGIGWSQRNVWLRMTEPDTAVMIAQAAPWSPGASGPIRGQVAEFGVRTEQDFEQYRGKLAGKIVLFGNAPPPTAPDRPMFERLTEKELEDFVKEPKPEPPPPYEKIFEHLAFRERIGRFLGDEGVAAVLTTSPGSGGTTFIDSNYGFGWKVYRRENAMRVPVLVVAVEHYGRMARLVQRKVPVSVELQVDVETTGDREEGFNTFADIPGANPNEYVMVSAHLDSWAAATGASDDGAGVVIAMEAMRILRALDVRPKRTIRLALWTGEEQGALGSRAWVSKYVAELPTVPSKFVPEFLGHPDLGRRRRPRARRQLVAQRRARANLSRVA